MTDRPISIRPKPLAAILASPTGRVRLRRPGDGLYKRLVPGDRLWLREAFYLPRRFNSRAPSQAEGLCEGPVFAVDLKGADPAALGLGGSRAAHTLPRFWSRFTFAVLGVTRQPLLDITEEEARAEGFSSREFWLRDWDDMVSAVSGRLRSRSSLGNPQVLVLDLQLHRQPVDGESGLARRIAA
jgi:hypothetical protein